MAMKIKIISGKGGVGKSSLATAIALKEASLGQKCLLVELEASRSLESYTGHSLGPEPKIVRDNLWAVRWEGLSCLKELLLHYLPTPKLAHMFFEWPFVKDFLFSAPGLKELAILGKLTSSNRKFGPPMDFDLIVVDGYSTGHLLSLLDAPRGMGKAFKIGPMGEQSRRISQVLEDPEVTEFFVVSLLEPLVVEESLEFCNELTGRGLSFKLVSNKKLPDLNKELSAAPEDSDSFVNYLGSHLDKQSRGYEKLKQYKSIDIPLFGLRHLELAEAISSCEGL